MVKVSVIIPAYNEERYIEKCLASLSKQSYRDKEIIVVDDGSTDRTIEIAKKYHIKIIRGEHKGPGFSRNLGAKKAQGKILVFIDADMHFDKEYIKNLVSPILKNSKIVGTTHDYEVATNTDNIWSRLWGKVRVAKETAHQVAIFRAIRRDAFLKMGGFDPKYGYADDQTFYYKYGIKPTVAKNTTCYHRNPESLKETYKQAIWIGRSWRRRFTLFKIPLLNLVSLLIAALLIPFKVVIKSVQVKFAMPDIPYTKIFQFYTVKFKGYLVGLTSALVWGEVRK